MSTRAASKSLAFLVLALLAAGCARRTTVRAYLPVPPQVAVRVFPEVIVVSGRTPDEVGLADAIALHLARAGRGRIERLWTDELALRRASGGFGPATAILTVEARVQERVRRDFGGRWSACWAEPCPVAERPIVEATLRLRVSEARTGRVLQEIELRERDEAGDEARRHARAISRLRTRAQAAFDPSQVALTLPLEDVDDADVRSAIALLREGEFRRGRSILDRVVRDASFDRRNAGEQARILFDLGQALRLEARAAERIDMEPIQVAEETLRRAAMLDPCAVYHEAITQVVSEREAEERMRDIDSATHANFAMAMPVDVPAPPPGYGYAMSP